MLFDACETGRGCETIEVFFGDCLCFGSRIISRMSCWLSSIDSFSGEFCTPCCPYFLNSMNSRCLRRESGPWPMPCCCGADAAMLDSCGALTGTEFWTEDMPLAEPRGVAPKFIDYSCRFISSVISMFSSILSLATRLRTIR